MGHRMGGRSLKIEHGTFVFQYGNRYARSDASPARALLFELRLVRRRFRRAARRVKAVAGRLVMHKKMARRWSGPNPGGSSVQLEVDEATRTGAAGIGWQ